MYKLSFSSEDTRDVASGPAQLVLVKTPQIPHAGVVACASPPPVHGQCEDFVRQDNLEPDYSRICPSEDPGTIRVVPVCLAYVDGGRSGSFRIGQLTFP